MIFEDMIYIYIYIYIIREVYIYIYIIIRGGYHYHDHVIFGQPPRDSSSDHRQMEVNIGLCKPLFNQSEAGILVEGTTIHDK